MREKTGHAVYLTQVLCLQRGEDKERGIAFAPRAQRKSFSDKRSETENENHATRANQITIIPLDFSPRTYYNRYRTYFAAIHIEFTKCS